MKVRQGFEFLGYQIKRGKQLRLPPGKIRSGAQPGALYAIPREKSVRRFMDQVRALTSRRVPLKTKELIEELNPVLRGWGHHYKRAHVRKLFHLPETQRSCARHMSGRDIERQNGFAESECLTVGALDIPLRLRAVGSLIEHISIRRRHDFKQAPAEETLPWLRRHLRQTYEPLLEHAWVLDLDGTVKPLYGKQEKAVKGYNPTKPGRPSHVVHTYLIAQLHLVLDAEVQAGNEAASSHAQPGFWAYFDTLPQASRPVFLRGDIAWGSRLGGPIAGTRARSATC